MQFFNKIAILFSVLPKVGFTAREFLNLNIRVASVFYKSKQNAFNGNIKRKVRIK